jgi:hypothetical protein
MIKYKQSSSFILPAKISFCLSLLISICLSCIIFVYPCHALYIDNSVHIKSPLEESKNISSEILDTEKAHGISSQLIDKKSQETFNRYQFSIVNLIEIVVTTITTFLGIKWFSNDRILNKSKTIKELRERIADLETIASKSEKKYDI